MARARCFAAALLLAWSSALAGSAAGQVVYGQPASARLRVIYTSWETVGAAGESSLEQVYVPFVGFIPLRDNLEARVFLGGVSNSLDRAGSPFALSGLNDARIEVNRSFADDRLLVSLGVNLPTGKTGLDFAEEWVVTGFLAQDFLMYPCRTLGGGLGLQALFGAATTVGEYRVGGSVLYQHAGSYEAYRNRGDYDPGDFLSVTGGFKRPFAWGFWTGDVTFTTHADDKQDGARIYNRGEQFLFRSGGVRETPGMRIAADVRYLVRDRNAVYDPAGVMVNQLQLYGNEFALTGSVSWFLADRKWELGPLLHLRMIAANEYDLGTSLNLGFGAQAERRLGPRYQLGLSCEVFTGEADGGAVDLGGYQVATSLSGSF